MIPSPSELNYFVEVANTLNISRAAERLGISQPTLSLAIQRLERSFGLPLLIRGKSGVQLTQGGKKLVVQARNLIEEWDRVRTDALQDEGAVAGHFTIGCHPAVALYSLTSILPSLLKDNPGLNVRLTHDLSRKITEEVISFKIDFGIVVNPVEHPDLVIRQLCKDEVTLWTAATPSSLQDASSGEGVLICDPELIQTQSLLKQLKKRGYRFARTVTSSNLEVITGLVASGAGVGILPGRVAGRIKALGLKPLRKDAPIYQDSICLVYRADAQRSKASRAIVQAIESRMDPDRQVVLAGARK